MRNILRRYIKLWVVALGLVAGLTVSKSAGAQIGYWSELGDSTPFYNPNAGPAYCMLYNEGQLYVPFTDSLNHIILAIWDGNSWQYDSLPLNFDAAAGFQSDGVACLAADDSGYIYLAGWFTDTSGAVVIKWNGESWSKVGTGAHALHTNNCPGCPPSFYTGGNVITSMCFDQANNLYVGGYFVNAQDNEYVAKWDGTNWSSLGNITILVIPSGTASYHGGGLGAYGGYLYALATTGMVKWDGNTWANIDTPNTHRVYDFVIGRNGNIYASMYSYVAMWDGFSWTQLGNLAPGIYNLYIDTNENLYAIGNFENSSGNYYVAKWSGNSWNELGENSLALHANDQIFGVAFTESGDSIFATGEFTNGVTFTSGAPYVAVYTTAPAGRLFVYLSATEAICGNNGAVATTMYQGTPPYTYSWSNGATSANLDSLVAGQYYVTVTDANGLIATGDVTVPGGTCQSIITGTVFVDSAGTCIYNGQQAVIPNVLLTLSGNSQTLYATTDANGNYSFAVPDTGNYYLYLQMGSGTQCGNYTLCGNPSHIIHVGVLGDSSNNNNFALTADSNSFDLYLHPGWTSADPGFEKDYWIYFANNTPVPFTGTATVAFKYDSSLTFLSSDVAYSSYNAATDSFTWVVSNFSNSGWNYIGKVRFHVPDSLPLNYQLHSQFWIYPLAGDCDTSNNYLQYYETVIGAHDPNYKEVSPSGNLSAADSVLTYTINYQNTGTDSTYFITVTDNLSPYLNPATVRNLASSVPYSSFTISGTGLLTWKFVPYSLVDSATNPSGSKGFITFSVNKMSNAPYGVQVSNSASVYFDYAPAVVTNTVTDTVVVCTTHRTSENLSICQGGTAYIGTHPYTQAGTYIDTLTGIGNCDSIVTLNLTVTNRDTITRSQGLCAGDSVYFYGHYIYNPGSYDTLLPGGCDTLVILNLVVQDPLPITHLYDTICANNPILFNGHSIDTTGTYTAHYSSVTGCDSVVKLALVVNLLPTVSISASVDSICQGTEVTFTASPGSYNSYLFYVHDSLVQQEASHTFSTYALAPGDTVSVTAYNGVCNSSPASAFVLVNPIPVPPVLTVSPSNDTICSGDTIIFTASAGYGYYIFSNGSSPQQTGDSPIWITDQLGQGNEVNVQGAINGCISLPSNSTSITVKPTPISIGGDSSVFCTGSNIVLGGPPTPGYTYAWTPATDLSSTTVSNPTLNSDSALQQTYTIITTHNGCSDSGGINIFIIAYPVVTFSLDTMVADGELTVLSTGDTIFCIGNGITQLVLRGANTANNWAYTGANVANNILTATQPGAYGFTYTAYNQLGCAVSVHDTIVAEICEGIQQITATNLFTLYPNPADDYTMIDFDPAYTGSTVLVKDITGRQLLQTKLTGSPQQLHTANLASGVYLVTLYSHGQTASKLLVKQ